MNVTLTAVDASVQELECIWNVHVPPLVEVGNISFPAQTAGQSVDRVSSPLGGSGRISKMTGRANQRLSGADSSVHARLREGSDSSTAKLKRERCYSNSSYDLLSVIKTFLIGEVICT
jgi:hypothetical protein